MTAPLRLTFAIGLAGGLLGALVGLGGGVVMIPLMLACCGLSRHQAHATSLAAVIATGTAGTLPYLLQGRFDAHAAGLLAGTAMTFSWAGARLAHRLKAQTLRRVFGVMVLTLAALLLAKPWLLQQGSGAGHALGWIGLGILGAVAGFFAGLMGVGGGGIMVPGMVLLAGLDQHTAQGTSLLVMVPAAIIGTWTHARAGLVATGLLPGLIPGVLLGALLGGFGANLIPQDGLRWMFGLFMCWLGWRDLRPAPARPPERT